MATVLPDINVPPLQFFPPGKSRANMTKEEFEAVFDVWMDAGSAIADALDIAIDNRDSAPPGTPDKAAWVLKVGELSQELTRLRSMGIELRVGQAVVEPPSAATVSAVDKVAREVGVRQKAMVRAHAAVSAVTAALTIASQVHV